MRLLLDTHVVIWVLSAPERLAPSERSLIVDISNDIFVSAVTVWEIAQKHFLGRKNAPGFSGREAITLVGTAGFTLINVTPDHAAAVETLPLLHADPFDRLLVAQALAEPFRLVTHDAKVAVCDPSIMLF